MPRRRWQQPDKRPRQRQRAAHNTLPALTALLLAFAVQQGFADSSAPAGRPAGGPPALHLRYGVVDTARPVLSAADAVARATASQRFVVQLDGPIDPLRRQRLEAAGVVLGDYLPSNAFVARLDAAEPQAVSGLEFVRWVSPFRSEWKVDPRLEQPDAAAAAARDGGAGESHVVVTLFAGEQPEAAIDQIVQAGAVVRGSSPAGPHTLIDAVLAEADAGGIAAIPAVQFIEPAPQGAFRNDSNRWIVQSNDVGHTPVWDAGLLGQGQIAGLIDGTVKETHCAFNDSEPIGPTHRKIVALRDESTPNSHGTHTAGSLAGDEQPWGVPDEYDGIAPAARLSCTNVYPIFSIPALLHTRLEDAHQDGARVHSNSWGDDTTTEYSTWCQQIDEFSYEYEDSLVVFSVTNKSTLRSPENAKNVLAVGASQDAPDQDLHCKGGTGPTDDGRRKPEVFAPGCGTWSASSSTLCDYTTKTGTSMACPVVAGAGVLVRQYFTDGYYPTGEANPEDALVPTGALMKAVLINAAVDMTGIGGYPSDQEGWGRVLLDNALYLPGDTARLYAVDLRNADGLSTGQDFVREVTAVSSAAPLRITLVFTDPPAAAGAADPVVNNLDLEITGPGGEVYKGNVFAGGESTTGGSFDGRNNVEQFLQYTPAAGTYAIRVSGTAVNEGTQGFALVVTGDIALTQADCNRDWVVDLDDFAVFSDCAAGPDGGEGPGCQCADLDEDDDIDLADFQLFQQVFGP